MSLCASCYPQLGLAGPLTNPCLSARTAERVRCQTVGTTTVPVVNVRRSNIGVYFYGVSSATSPPPGGNVTVSGSLAAPAGCGTPTDDLIAVGGLKWLVAGSDSTAVQIQATVDYVTNVGSPPSFPGLPVARFDTRPAGLWLVLDYIDRVATIPAGQTRFFSARIIRGPSGPTWDFVDIGEFMFHHYANK